MATDRKELDLIMRAQFQGKETLDGVIKSVSNLEEVLKKQSEAAKKGEVSLDELKSTSLALEQAMSKLKGFGGLIGEYEKLSAKTDSLAEKVDKAKAAYAALNTTVSESGVPTEKQVEQLGKLGKAVELAEARYARQQATLAQYREELAKADIELTKFADAEERLRAASADSGRVYATAQAEIANYATNTKRAREEVEKSSNSHSFFNDNGRTTLSLLQRIRGEVLAVTAAYVGLYGAIDGAAKIITAYNERAGVLNMLTVQSGGDKGKAAEEYKYISDQADRLGISLSEAAKGYAKFSTAATFAGRSVQENRFVFESVSEVGRVAHLTSEQMQRVFYAISQIDSKGRVMAEEFNQQLGDALPGLTGIAQKATDGIFKDFNQAMKDGKVSLGVFVDILAKYRDSVKGQLPDAIKTLQADQERLNNSMYDFKLAVADAGFADAYKQLVNDLTAFFKSSDGATFAKSVSDALSIAVNGVRLLITHFDELKLLVEVVATLFGARLVVQIGMATASLITFLDTAVAGMRAFQIATMSAATAFKALGGAITVYLIGLEFGSWLYASSQTVQKYSQIIIGYFDLLFTKIGGYVRAGKELASGNLEEAKKVLAESAQEQANIRQMIADLYNGKYDDKPRSASQGKATTTAKPTDTNDADRRDLQKRIDEQLAQLETSLKRKSPGAFDAIKAQYDTLANQIAELGGKEGDALTKRLENLHNKWIAHENSTGKARINARKEIESQLNNLEAGIDRKETDSLDKRLEAIKKKYDNVFAEINSKTGGKDATELRARATKDMQDAILQEQEAFAKRRKDAQDKIDQDVRAANEAVGKKNLEDLAGRMAAEGNLVRDDYNKKLERLDKERAIVAANNGDTGKLDTQREILVRDGEQAVKLREKAVAEEALAKAMRDVNDIIEKRRTLLAAEDLKQSNGQSPSLTAANKRTIVDATQGDYDKLKKNVDGLIASNTQAFDPVSVENWHAATLKADETLTNMNGQLFTAADMNQRLGDGMVTGFTNISKSIGSALVGMKSWAQAFTDVRNAFLNFAADFLMQMAQMILKQAIFNSMKGSSAGGFFASFGNAIMGTGATQAHSGAIIGSGSGVPRQAPVSWFANAPRYHTGGISGLAPSEYPAILQKNEEVLRANDPRNILNGGAAANGGGQSSPTNIKIINQIDSGSVVTEGLATPAGEQAFYNFVRANKTGVRQLLGV